MDSSIFFSSNPQIGSTNLFGELSFNDNKRFNIILSDLTSDDQVICDNFINIFTNDTLTYLINSPNQLECNIIITGDVSMEYTTLDYESLNDNDKNSVLNFIQLIERI
jgi:hypothetical protein